MARKPRNYKAEYARRKAKAQKLGYDSPYQERKARKALGLSRDFPTVERKFLPDFVHDALQGGPMARMRRESAEWSKAHSHVKASRYSGNMSNEQTRDYYRAYVESFEKLGKSRRTRAKERRRRIYEYLKKYGFPVEGEKDEAWKSNLSPA